MNGPCRVSEICGVQYQWNKHYEVQFSELVLDWKKDYDDDNELRVCGIREPNTEELQFLEQYRKEEHDRGAKWRREQYEQLKREFES